MDATTKRLIEWLLLQVKYVEIKLPHVQFQWKSKSEAFFIFPIQSTVNPQAKAVMKLRICPTAPEAVPELIVWDPIELPKMPSGTINSWGGSGTFHTAPLTADGRVTICHTPHGQWSMRRTYLQVLLKSLLWWEAYQLHLQDGKSIDQHFRSKGLVS